MAKGMDSRRGWFVLESLSFDRCDVCKCRCVCVQSCMQSHTCEHFKSSVPGNHPLLSPWLRFDWHISWVLLSFSCEFSVHRSGLFNETPHLAPSPDHTSPSFSLSHTYTLTHTHTHVSAHTVTGFKMTAIISPRTWCPWSPVYAVCVRMWNIHFRNQTLPYLLYRQTSCEKEYDIWKVNLYACYLLPNEWSHCKGTLQYSKVLQILSNSRKQQE